MAGDTPASTVTFHAGAAREVDAMREMRLSAERLHEMFHEGTFPRAWLVNGEVVWRTRDEMRADHQSALQAYVQQNGIRALNLTT
jgi:hypothetical protein